MTALMLSLPDALRRVRKVRGLSQEAFSDVSSRTYLSSLERGLKSPTLNKIEDVCTVLDVHPLTLLVLAYAGSDPKSIHELMDKIALEVSSLSEPSKNNWRRDMFKNTGLDKLQKNFKDVEHALSELDGELGVVNFDPYDPASIESAIQSVNLMIDERLAEYSSNAIVGPLAEQMKEKYRESILEKAAEARLQLGEDE